MGLWDTDTKTNNRGNPKLSLSVQESKDQECWEGGWISPVGSGLDGSHQWCIQGLRQVFNITVHLYDYSEIKLIWKDYSLSYNSSIPDHLQEGKFILLLKTNNFHLCIRANLHHPKSYSVFYIVFLLFLHLFRCLLLLVDLLCYMSTKQLKDKWK